MLCVGDLLGEPSFIALERRSFFFFSTKCEASLFYLGGISGDPLEEAVNCKALGFSSLSSPSMSLPPW